MSSVASFCKSLKAGDPKESSTHLPPLFTQGSTDNVLGMIHEAKEAGAEVFLGDLTQQGSVLHPHLLKSVKPGMKIWDRETFGPGMPKNHTYRRLCVNAIVALQSSSLQLWILSMKPLIWRMHPNIHFLHLCGQRTFIRSCESLPAFALVCFSKLHWASTRAQDPDCRIARRLCQC